MISKRVLIMKLSLVFFLLVSLPFLIQGQRAAIKSIRARELKSHVVYLSSDLLAGRLTGEPGQKMAAN
jgi:hypothetical protein